MSIQIIVTAVLCLLNVVILVKLFLQKPTGDQNHVIQKFEEYEKRFDKNEVFLKDEFSRNRDENNKNAKDSREEIQTTFTGFTQLLEQKLSNMQNANTLSAKEARDELSKSLKSFEEKFNESIKDFNDVQKQKFDELGKQQTELTRETKETLEKHRDDLQASFKGFSELLEQKLSNMQHSNTLSAKETRDELSKSLKSFEEKFGLSVKDFNDVQRQKFDELGKQQTELTKETKETLEKVRSAVELKLSEIQKDNSEKLEKMRETVDEKLHKTLETRLGESFKIVSERLELVQKGLGEMQNLATGVGELKNVLSNVKTKGVLGEYQLASILEQVLTPNQYSQNVKTKAGSNDHVEFAVMIPNKNDSQKNIWLPIDAKFPSEDYERLMNAYDASSVEQIEKSKKEIEKRIKSFAKDIATKYIDPPSTTDFAIMFLPFEGLYAEVLRIPGLFESLQRDFKITITGPTTISAFLNSLQMGFRTLAVEKRTSEIWSLLGAVRTEFGKFGEVLENTQKKLASASKEIENAGVRSRQIERKLKDVQELPETEATKLLDA
ncbi:MAG: DNA recombination protein RmuC [Treponemataceae bacterium]